MVHSSMVSKGLVMMSMSMTMMIVWVARDGGSRWMVEAQLVENFYSLTCPNVESIVQQAVNSKMAQTGTFVPIPATLRLFFHDCFIEGCDGSIMIASPNADAEKDAPDNVSLAGDGFDTVIKAKQAVEAQCPGVVSCADILAIAARDVVVLGGGPFFNVELGRRDGLISMASLVAGKLPQPTFDVSQLSALFGSNNLSTVEMVALSGAHTIGFSHCTRFMNRLYSFSPSNPVDPSLNPSYAQQLMQSCPQDVDPRVAVNLDPTTPKIFDNIYFQNLAGGKGVFTSDQALFADPSTQPTVTDFANSPFDFNAAFISAMRQLGRTSVKTGNQGEIRLDCTTFNS